MDEVKELNDSTTEPSSANYVLELATNKVEGSVDNSETKAHIDQPKKEEWHNECTNENKSEIETTGTGCGRKNEICVNENDSILSSKAVM